MRRVYRTSVPVDDGWHTITMRGPILHVATRFEDQVEVWHLDDDETAASDRTFRVVGTGHSFAPALATHVGTAITPSGVLVWHLFEHG